MKLDLVRLIQDSRVKESYIENNKLTIKVEDEEFEDYINPIFEASIPYDLEFQGTIAIVTIYL